jgi:hypothetical protein
MTDMRKLMEATRPLFDSTAQKQKAALRFKSATQKYIALLEKIDIFETVDLNGLAEHLQDVIFEIDSEIEMDLDDE